MPYGDEKWLGSFIYRRSAGPLWSAGPLARIKVPPKDGPEYIIVS